MDKELRDFESEYWAKMDQGICFRHKAAFALVDKGLVLDLGCGDGLFLNMLKNKGIKGIGIEVSEIAIKKARTKELNVRQFNFTTNKLPFPDNSFETVVLLDVLEHLYQPTRVLKEVHRVSKRNLLISVPNFNSLPARIQMLLGKIPENNKHRQGHVYWMSYSIIKDLLEESSFSIEAIKVNSFFSWVPGIRNLMQFLAEKKPSIFALNFVIKAKKS